MFECVEVADEFIPREVDKTEGVLGGQVVDGIINNGIDVDGDQGRRVKTRNLQEHQGNVGTLVR